MKSNITTFEDLYSNICDLFNKTKHGLENGNIINVIQFSLGWNVFEVRKELDIIITGDEIVSYSLYKYKTLAEKDIEIFICSSTDPQMIYKIIKDLKDCRDAK